MDIRSTLFALGVFLLALTGAIFLLNPSEVVTKPDPDFNVEVSSHVDGDADFVYIPTTNETIDVYMSYNISVDNKTRESIDDRRLNNVSKKQPITVIVEAEPKQMVRVDMTITDLKGRALHNSHHTISGQIEK